MNFKRIRCFALITGTILFGMNCYNPTNPFLDAERAKASVYAKTFNDRDTVSIFSRETLSVVIYLREHLKEVVVHVDKNRLGSSDDTSISIDSFTGDPVKIPFSFYDTGWQKIIVRSLQNSGKIFTEECSLYARTPLSQKTLRGNIGDTVRLKTEPVNDAQVLYVWDFHDGNVVKEYTNDVPFILKKNVTSTIGELYVTDPRHRSPSVPFSIDTRSATLELVSLNDSISKDTVFTSQTNFLFKVALNGTEKLKNASLNGLPFDNIKVQSGFVQLSRTFNRLDTLKDAMKAVVVATDDQGTTVGKTFFIQYDNTLTIELPKIVLNVPSTTNDTGYVMQSQLVLLGKINGTITYEQLYIQSIVNGKPAATQIISPNSTDWTLPVQLLDGWNLIQIQLSKDSVPTGAIIAAKAIHVNCNPNKIDITAPIINAIKINDLPLSTSQNNISRNKNVTLSVLASDNKKVTSVTINEDKAAADAAGLVFSRIVTLSHDKAVQPYIVCAEDSAGNKVCDTVTICYNRAPEILSVSIPSTMNIDSEYVFTMRAADPDSDVIVSTLTLKSTKVDTVLTLVNGSVRWKPLLKDTGALRLTLHVSDHFFESADTSQTVQVLLNKEQIPPVLFKTVAGDFPDSILIGKTLSVMLKTDPLTGTAPLRYTVYLKNPSTKLYDGTNPAITWTPTRADAGVQTLQAIVYDNAGFSDTINALITVVAQAAATVWMTSDTLNISEGGKVASFGLRLSTPLADTVRIPYRIVYASASGADAKLDSIGTIIFKPGDTLVNMPFEVVDDTIVESEEALTILLPSLPPLSGRDSLVVDSKKAQLHVIIRDNDNSTGPKVGVMLQPKQIPNVPEIAYIGRYPAVVLTAALPFDLTVTIKPTAASTAVFGSDFSLTSENIVVKAGTTMASLQLLLINDRIHEETEYIELEIVKISNSTIAIISDQKTTRVQVIDDD